jgi:GntR family transcriptional regulator/MocR family aminotransferase
MYLQLDGRGPLHAQLTRALKAAMLDGALTRGTRLPATRTLSNELGLSRNTVLAAYEQLRAEGFIEGRVGSGSYVASRMRTAKTPRRLQGESAPQSAYAARMRECFDILNQPGVPIPEALYSFQYGVPMTNPILTTTWARHLSHAAQYTSPGYPRTQGVPALRQAVCDYLARRRGVLATPEDVLIVAGTQQAVTLIARVLVDVGDEVVIEDPHYNAIRNVLQAHGATMRPVPVDENGLVCDALPRGGAKLICVTPSHQFPTGAVLSLERRMALLEYAERHDAWIFEDDYDGEFRYNGKPLAALRSLDEHQRVVYVGTFSKSIFPGLRLGYLVMPPALRRDFVAAKWMNDFGTTSVEQVALAHFIGDGGFDRHMRRTAQVLRERRTALIEGLERCSQGRLRIADSQTGMHLVVWLDGRSEADVATLIEYGRGRGIALYSIAPYYLNSPRRVGLLMGYCGMSVTQIEDAMVLFGQCLDAVFPIPGRRLSTG